jgi:hypothetical protein
MRADFYRGLQVRYRLIVNGLGAGSVRRRVSQGPASKSRMKARDP